MEIPQIRPGRVSAGETPLRVVSFFYNSAQGNSAIQLLTTLGIPNDALGVTPPERIEHGQGMVLSIALLAGYANVFMLLALWLVQMSFVNSGQLFYGYGWETQLL